MRSEEIDGKDGFYISHQVVGTDCLDSNNYSTFFVCTIPCEVLTIVERHETAGTHASAVTLQVRAVPDGSSVGNGVALLRTAFDLKGAIRTAVLKHKNDLVIAKTLDVGDALALETAGTLTSVNNVCVTVYLKPLGRGDYR